MKKRLIALLLSVLLVLTSVCAVYATGTDAEPAATSNDYVEQIVSGEGEEAETFTFVEKASNDSFVLAIDEATTFVSLTDKRTGQAWYTNPPIALNEDPYAQGMAKTDLRSVLHLVYTNASKKEKEANSYSGSVMKDAFEIKEVKDGIRVDYNFEEAKIIIPVQYTLAEDGMIAQILYSEIKEESTNTVNHMDFLMYFGTAGEEDEGYLIVPDGSGAIINFNNDKNVDGMKYDKEIYGLDYAEVTETATETSREEKVNLPVYGMVKNGYGFLAEITAGAENASLKAISSGNRLVGGYNTIYTNATYRVNYELPLMGQVSSETSNAMFNAEDPVSLEAYTVQFHFTDDKETDYTKLASLYRDILLERGWLTKDDITDTLYTELYGGVNKKKSFLGIVYNDRQTLTSFDDAQEILSDLKAGGVDNINVQYVDFSDDSFSRDIEITLTPSGSLGGEKSLSDLLAYAEENGIPAAFAADFVTLPSGGNGYSTFNDVADAINISPIKVYGFSLQANTMDTTKKPSYLVDPQKYEKGVTTLLEAVDEYDYDALYFDNRAVQLYSDLAPEGYQAERTSGAQAAQYARIAETDTAITMSDPNAYLFAYADYMVNIPVCSSKELIFDEDIPFLQTVLRGVKNFGGESMNITDVSDESFLRHLEYGTDVRYALIKAESEALLTTGYSFLYSATYDTFKEQIKERYAVLKDFGEAVEDSTIVSHSRENGVAVTEYSNGAKVVVNYNDEAVTVDGTTVDAMGYAFV